MVRSLLSLSFSLPLILPLSVCLSLSLPPSLSKSLYLPFCEAQLLLMNQVRLGIGGLLS